ncbi:MAG TPA: hypothetical protein PKD85_00230 [Saprospiraceae bacterium]|nr:hypothetical protein [Saprospiraceae bacterium]
MIKKCEVDGCKTDIIDEHVVCRLHKKICDICNWWYMGDRCKNCMFTDAGEKNKRFVCQTCRMKNKEQIICACGCKEKLYDCDEHGNSCKSCSKRICKKYNLCEEHRAICSSCKDATRPTRLRECMLCDKKFCSCGYMKFSDPKYKVNSQNLRLCPSHLRNCLSYRPVSNGNAPLKPCRRHAVIKQRCDEKTCDKSPCTSCYFWSAVDKKFIKTCHDHVDKCDFCSKNVPSTHCRELHYKNNPAQPSRLYIICKNCDKIANYLKDVGKTYTYWNNNLTMIILSYWYGETLLVNI